MEVPEPRKLEIGNWKLEIGSRKSEVGNPQSAIGNPQSAIRNPSEAGRYVPRGLLLQWHVTNRCNLRCAHCYQESYGGAELDFPDLLRLLEQFRELLDGWSNAAGPPPPWGQITVTGGEPFVRPDFLDLLEVLAAHQERFRFAILTNGSLIDAALARRLRPLRPAFVQVSVEGSEATHDRIRGPGNLARTVAAIRHLVRERVPTLISFTAHQGNFREFPEVARLGRRLGVTRVWADRLIPSGQAFSPGGRLPAEPLRKIPPRDRHCEERSDEAISSGGGLLRYARNDTDSSERPLEPIRKVADCSADILSACRLEACATGFSERPLAALTPEETREFCELLHQARTEAARGWFGRTEVAMHRALQFLVGGGPPYHCTAGETLLTVMPNGDVYPCRRMPIRVGNLRETPLRELYAQSDLLRSLRDRNRISRGCEECAWSRRCRGGLRCLSYAMTGDPFQADPGCWLAER